jgi:hypothetical protein
MWVSKKYIEDQNRFNKNLEDTNTMLIEHIGELMKRVEIIESHFAKPRPKIPKLEDVIPSPHNANQTSSVQRPEDR